jgi:N utilization substance protein B
MSGPSDPSGDPMAGRRAARLAAVQALYQLEQGGGTLARMTEELRAGRLPMGDVGPLDGAEPDAGLFERLVAVTMENQEGVDRTIARHLNQKWRLERIDSVARAILRAGVAELWSKRETPSAVIVDEYVEIAKAFFDTTEPAFVNAALEACAHDVRGADAFAPLGGDERA